LLLHPQRKLASYQLTWALTWICVVMAVSGA
jgi:hypothetical protein